MTKPKICILIARGEAARNFVYTKFLKYLSAYADVTVLTIIKDKEFFTAAKPYVKRIIQLKSYKENSLVILFREIIHTAHYRYIWTEAVKYYWGRHNDRVKNNLRERIRLIIWRSLSYIFANSTMLKIGTSIDRWLSIYLRPTLELDLIFTEMKPDMIFNCSHIHGTSADLPMRVARHLKIPTSVFLFSWDNLSSRGRIFPKYDYYFVWTRNISNHLYKLYKGSIKKNQIIASGTPQFDFHFDKNFEWTKEKLFKELNLNIKKNIILYTTGMASDFPGEHKFIETLIDHIKKKNNRLNSQLVIRTYLKGNSNEILRLSEKYKNDDVVFFPPILWNEKWMMPMVEDLHLYSNLIRYSSLGINAASTVSLELMMFNKPVINIGFEPEGIELPNWSRFSRHVQYEHYLPLVKSGAVKVAKSSLELCNLVDILMSDPALLNNNQKLFLTEMFQPNTLGNSADEIVKILRKKLKKNDNEKL